MESLSGERIGTLCALDSDARDGSDVDMVYRHGLSRLLRHRRKRGLADGDNTCP